GGGVRDLRPAPRRSPGRSRRAPWSAGRPRVLEEPEGPPARLRRDPSEGSERPDELDGERVRPRGPRTTGGGPRRIRHGPTARSAQCGCFRPKGLPAPGPRPKRGSGEGVRGGDRGESCVRLVVAGQGEGPVSDGRLRRRRGLPPEDYPLRPRRSERMVPPRPLAGGPRSARASRHRVRSDARPRTTEGEGVRRKRRRAPVAETIRGGGRRVRSGRGPRSDERRGDPQSGGLLDGAPPIRGSGP